MQNAKVDENLGTKEKMMDYNYNGDDYSRMTNRGNALFFKTNNDMQNNVQIEDVREEQNAVPEIRVEAVTPTPNRNLTRNHRADQIIGSNKKGVMTRRKINEELCLISQVEPRSFNEAIKDDY